MTGDAVEASFVCSVCGEQAGAIELRRNELRRESFTSVLSGPVTAEDFRRLRAAVLAADAAAIFEVDPELAPFYCPQCRTSYCGAHWERWDVFDEDLPGWHDSIRGRCPHGHERMLED